MLVRIADSEGIATVRHLDEAAYVFEVDGATGPTPRPWTNMPANPGYGCMVTESAGGSIRAGNSKLHQIIAGLNAAGYIQACPPGIRENDRHTTLRRSGR